MLLPHQKGEERLEMYLHLPEILWESSEEECHLPDPISLSVPTLAPPPCLEEGTQTEEESDCHPASTQMEGGQAITQPSSFCRMLIKPELNRNMNSSRKYRNLLKDMIISKPNRPGGMQSSGHRWLTRLMPLSRRYFSRWVQQRLPSYYPGAFLQQCLSAT